MRVKEFLILFILQVLNYSLLCINFRAIALANYIFASLSDFAIATLSFFVIKRIASSTETVHQWLGYAMGGVVGTYVGIYISTLIHN